MSKTLKVVVLCIIVVGLTACGRMQREYAGWIGQPTEICVNNVKYLQFTSGATVEYNSRGNIVTCN